MNRSRGSIVLLGLLSAGYAAQLFSPLRTNTDATCYMEMAASASDGAGFLCCKNAEHYPVGYPALLMLLDRAGLACSATFIGINLASLAVGLVASAFVLRKSFGWTAQAAVVGASVTLLNWVTIKHVTLPLTDFAYLGLSLLGLLALTDASGRDYPDRLAGLSAGLILLALAVSVRTVAIALVPAFAFAALPASWRTGCIDAIRRNRLVAVGLALGIVLVGLASLLVVARTNYFREMLEHWGSPIDLVVLRLDDWGELVLNVSMAKVPGWLRGLQLAAGGLGAALLFSGFAIRRRLQVVDVYLAAYLAILLLWPYRDARFWIPVFPLMLGYVGASAGRLLAVFPRLSRIAPLYSLAYSLLGLVAIGYSSWLTFSGDRFGDRFAGGVYRESYRAASGLAPADPSGRDPVDPQIVRLLERYRLDRPGAPRDSVADSPRVEMR